VPDRRPGRPHRFDIPGVLLATAGLLGVVFGLIEGQRYSWGAVVAGITIPEIIGAGAALLVVFLAYQALRQGREPLLPFAVFQDRNFALMTVVMCGLGFAMVGVYLPLTIYLQSVLGLSAIAAGLTIAPQPVAMFFASGLAAGLTRKVSGKYLLIPGLLAFAGGVAYIAWAAHADSGRWSFLPGLIASGIGLGFTWTPVFSLATRDLKPHLAGVASGVVNTIQEVGAVTGSAVLGAVLQNRLAANLRLPAGVPVGVARNLQHVTHVVFAQGFVDAMRPTLLIPIAVVVAAALATGAVRKTPLDSPAWETSSEAGVRTSSATSSVSS